MGFMSATWNMEWLESLSCYDVQQDQTTESPFAQTRERITLFVPSMPRGGVMAGETSPR